MDTITEPQFVTWAQARGIDVGPLYPKVVAPSFGTSAGTCSWEVPAEPQRRPHFLSSVLKLMGDWKLCYAWRHSGSWPDAKSIDPRRINNVVEYQILAGLGTPMGSAHVLGFSSEETASLITLMFSTTVFGWSIGEDLVVVPDNGSVIVQTDHHDFVHVEFRNPEGAQAAVRQMDAEGFSDSEALAPHEP